MESDDECEFDSTWQDEDENKTPKKKVLHRRSQRKMNAAKDMQNFRHSCRNLDGDEDHDKPGQGHFYNLEFYRGQIKSSPDDVHIDDFHQKWWGKYDLLQDVTTFIQWLFPLQTQGVNPSAHVLTKKEIKLFRKDKQVKSKLVKSYKLMLDFYGIHLVDESTGEVTRGSNWEDRFRNLNRYSNNNLRITRILKCLGTLGLKHYQTPLVKFFLHETLVKGQLQNVKQSVLDYFLFAVLEKSDRRELVRFAFNHFKPQEHFVWGPKKILLGQVACCKNEKVDQPTDYKQSRNVKDQQKRVKPQGSKHEMNRSYPLKKMESKKDHQNKDEAVTANKLKETKSDQGENKSIIIPNKLRDAVNSSYQTEEKTSCQVSEHEESEDKQKWVNLNELKHEIKKIDANYLPEEIESKIDHQNLDEPVTVNKLKETKSVQEANKSSQCRSENESVAKINNEMTVGVGDDDVSGPYQTIEMSSCEMSDMSVGDDNGSLLV